MHSPLFHNTFPRRLDQLESSSPFVVSKVRLLAPDVFLQKSGLCQHYYCPLAGVMLPIASIGPMHSESECCIYLTELLRLLSLCLWSCTQHARIFRRPLPDVGVDRAQGFTVANYEKKCTQPISTDVSAGNSPVELGLCLTLEVCVCIRIGITGSQKQPDFRLHLCNWQETSSIAI